MRRTLLAGLTFLTLGLLSVPAEEKVLPPEKLGLRCEGSTYFPVPKGTIDIPMPGSDFETGKIPPGWALGGGEIVADADAPQGKYYCRFPARKGTILLTPRDGFGQPGKPHFISFWLRSPEDHWTCIGFTSDEPLATFGDHYPGIPSTANKWRRVGYYVWLPAQCKGLHLQIQPHKDSEKGQFISVDDIRLRTATEEEMSAAYEADRARQPKIDLSPRPEDGRNLALSVAKWQNKAGLPGKPFVIWAVGSSWTNSQGDGYPLIRAIRERFPNGPTIIYKRHAGSGTPWDYARGWVRQFVIAEQPDLVLTYTNGSPEGLDALLTEVRRHTTADVIVPSIHFFHNSTLTEDDVEKNVVDWRKVRDICRRHQVEFVENRRELAAYLKQTDQKPTALLGDVVHQNYHGFIRIWDNITRHIAVPESFSYDPSSRERRVTLAQPPKQGLEKITLSKGWTLSDGKLKTSTKGEQITVQFQGNRIDLIGHKQPAGGSIRLFIDNKPAEEVPVFLTTFIQPKPKQWPLKLVGPGAGDIAPHAVELGTNLIPQKWTITMTSESGDFRLEGSVTGPDGAGKVGEFFTSKSGQIRIDPALWRHGKTDKKGTPFFGNGTGDSFTFEVYRTGIGQISFQGSPGIFSEAVIRNLPNGPHVLQLVTVGDGEIMLDSAYVFQPPSGRKE